MYVSSFFFFLGGGGGRLILDQLGIFMFVCMLFVCLNIVVFQQ